MVKRSEESIVTGCEEVLEGLHCVVAQARTVLQRTLD
jgi:hypothetical protein